jgi:hypothetical protein
MFEANNRRLVYSTFQLSFSVNASKRKAFAFSQKIEGSSTQAAIEIQCGASPLES